MAGWGWVGIFAAAITIVISLAVVFGRKYQSEVTETTIRAYKEAVDSLTVRNEQMGKEIAELRATTEQQREQIHILTNIVTAKDDVAALANLVGTSHAEVLRGFEKQHQIVQQGFRDLIDVIEGRPSVRPAD
jgi:hypothetical protein